MRRSIRVVHEGWVGTAMLGRSCGYLKHAGRGHVSAVLPGDLVTMCTASAVWRVLRLELGGVAVLAAAGMTPGDGWRAGREYRVHVAHLEYASQHDAADLFATLAAGACAGGASS